MSSVLELLRLFFFKGSHSLLGCPFRVCLFVCARSSQGCMAKSLSTQVWHPVGTTAHTFPGGTINNQDSSQGSSTPAGSLSYTQARQYSTYCMHAHSFFFSSLRLTHTIKCLTLERWTPRTLIREWPINYLFPSSLLKLSSRFPVRLSAFNN